MNSVDKDERSYGNLIFSVGSSTDSKQYEEFFDSIGLTMDDVLIFHSNANLNRKGYYFFDYF